LISGKTVEAAAFSTAVALLGVLNACRPAPIRGPNEAQLAPTAAERATLAAPKGRNPSEEPSIQPSVVANGSNSKVWSKIEIAFEGPEMDATDSQSNPFQVVLDVILAGPDGVSYKVPAFFDGDGLGGQTGESWKVRFSPDRPGVWHYETRSDEPLLDHIEGSFTVDPPQLCQDHVAGTLPDFSCVGRLEEVGGHFLKFADGPYWLKGGVDDPEDFLAPGQTAGMPSKQAAVDYLASVGINSMYILLMNVGGDGQNVWPWVGQTQAVAMKNHRQFDVGKLDEWDRLFSYVQSKGIVLHLVLEDDSGWKGFDRGLYYREMVARFGYHNGVIWNLSEEYDENYSPANIKTFGGMLAELDPYDHPITVHHSGGTDAWLPFVDDPVFSLTSFQTAWAPQNNLATTWYWRMDSLDHPAATSFDEVGKTGARARIASRRIFWSIFTAAGNFELHTYPLRDYREFEQQFNDLARAREVVEQMPFWNMQPHNELIGGGQGYVLAELGSSYLVYLPAGGPITFDLSSAQAASSAHWVDPATGNRQVVQVSEGQTNTLEPPSSSPDAVLVIAVDKAD